MSGSVNTKAGRLVNEDSPRTPAQAEVTASQVIGIGNAASTCGPCVVGKFIYTGAEKFYVKGVSYGAFRPDAEQREYHDTAQIEQDFALMAAHGINTVRIPHTMPPRSLLDIALRHRLRVMVGLSAEQYVGYLIDTDKKAPRY